MQMRSCMPRDKMLHSPRLLDASYRCMGHLRFILTTLHVLTIDLMMPHQKGRKRFGCMRNRTGSPCQWTKPLFIGLQIRICISDLVGWSLCPVVQRSSCRHHRKGLKVRRRTRIRVLHATTRSTWGFSLRFFQALSPCRYSAINYDRFWQFSFCNGHH